MEVPQIYTSRWANRELAHLDCVPVGISRGLPRWPLRYRYRLLRSLAPSREAFTLHDQEEFTAVYRQGLEELGIDRILADFARIGAEHGGRPLCLLCFEAVPGDWCHRRVLAEWLEERAGIEVPELEPGRIGGAPPPAQTPLF